MWLEVWWLGSTLTLESAPNLVSFLSVVWVEGHPPIIEYRDKVPWGSSFILVAERGRELYVTHMSVKFTRRSYLSVQGWLGSTYQPKQRRVSYLGQSGKVISPTAVTQRHLGCTDWSYWRATHFSHQQLTYRQSRQNSPYWHAVFLSKDTWQRGKSSLTPGLHQTSISYN